MNKKWYAVCRILIGGVNMKVIDHSIEQFDQNDPSTRPEDRGDEYFYFYFGPFDSQELAIDRYAAERDAQHIEIFADVLASLSAH